MTSLLDPRAIEPHVETVLEALRPQATVVVGGPEGAGRGYLAGRVSSARKTLEVEAPPLVDADAGVHLLFQMISFVPADQRDAIFAAKDLRASAFEATKRAMEGSNAEVLSLRLPRSWERLLETREDDQDEAQLDRVRDVLRGIQDFSAAPLMILCGAGRFEWKRWLRSPTFVLLGPAASKLDLLDDETLWGEYVAHSRAVLAACKHEAWMPTPLQARLCVALASLGVSPNESLTTSKAAPPGALWPLLKRLRRSLASTTGEHRALRDALGSVLVARRPVPIEIVTALAPSTPTTFFAECIGYETSEGVRIPEVVRDELSGVASAAAERPGHERLLQHYKALDGVAKPNGIATVTAMRAWLERAHHAALLRDEAEWNQLEPPCPEFYWSRARWLSRVCKEYAAAADVYAAGVARFPDDDYGWHYFAWNAERAGRPTSDVEPAYKEAIAINETNRWWNSRYVTFLIRRAQYRRAEIEYAEGLAKLRTSGAEATLAPIYHRWIIAEWLEQGEVARARSVAEDVPEDAWRDPRLARELERLLDAEEAEALGVSIYPAGHRVSRRWKRPGVLPNHVASNPLSSWYPAYVSEATSESVTIFLATTTADRRVIRRELSRADWSAAAGDLEPVRGIWIYVARYGELTRIVLNPTTDELPAWADEKPLEISAYLRSWVDGGAHEPKGS